MLDKDGGVRNQASVPCHGSIVVKCGQTVTGGKLNDLRAMRSDDWLHQHKQAVRTGGADGIERGGKLVGPRHRHEHDTDTGTASSLGNVLSRRGNACIGRIGKQCDLVVVALWAARVAATAWVTMTSILPATISRASSFSRASLPSANLSSMMMVLPS